jgi:hypothetical protein
MSKTTNTKQEDIFTILKRKVIARIEKHKEKMKSMVENTDSFSSTFNHYYQAVNLRKTECEILLETIEELEKT